MSVTAATPSPGEGDANFKKGLKGVVAADTAICRIDGDQGILSYRGYNIHDLAQQSTFEEVAYLLFKGELPGKQELAAFRATLAANRDVPPAVVAFLKSLPKDALPMTALRCAVSLCGLYDPDSEDRSPEANLRKSIRLTSQLATLVAAIHRVGQGKEPLPSKPELSHAANFMYLLNGKPPTADEAKAMDLVLILHAEHDLNASTFTARVIAATLSDLYSVITGAIGALKGPLHGGANTEVLKTLMEIGSIDKVPAWIEETKAKKGIFMGFGHAVYKVEDPRARHLKELSRRLSAKASDPQWYQMSAEIEKRVNELIKRNCNVDFYSASLQHYMGIPGDLFTCVFAASRIVGWCAHALEQWSDNKIIRPSSNYHGSPDRAYAPLDKR
jgi:citrate synthase